MLRLQSKCIEIDPRSKTTADGAFNLIATGKPELEVQGQRCSVTRKEKKF